MKQKAAKSVYCSCKLQSEANKYQNDSPCELSTHFRFCVLWRSCYPQATAAKVGVSGHGKNYFVPQTSTQKYHTKVSSNIIASKMKYRSQHNKKCKLVYTDKAMKSWNLTLSSPSTSMLPIKLIKLHLYLSLIHRQHIETRSTDLCCGCMLMCFTCVSACVHDVHVHIVLLCACMCLCVCVDV